MYSQYPQPAPRPRRRFNPMWLLGLIPACLACVVVVVLAVGLLPRLLLQSIGFTPRGDVATFWTQQLTLEPVSLATPLASETVRMKWFDFPRTLGLMALPLATLASGAWVWFQLGRSDWKPFAGAVTIFVLAFAGLAYSLYPYVVMDRMTIWQAAAHPSSLKVVLVGALIVLPFIVAYTVFSYRVFRGKARAGLYEH